MPTSPITIPRDLLPADGRFGCGPSKIRQQSIDALTAATPTLLGTSHRQQPVRHLVGRVRAGLRELFELPDGYEVILGNGGTTVFWDAATFGLIRKKSQHVSYGEFSARFAQAAITAPHLDSPAVIEALDLTIAHEQQLGPDVQHSGVGNVVPVRRTDHVGEPSISSESMPRQSSLRCAPTASSTPTAIAS